MSVSGIISLMRPRQWVKNGFVLAPTLFTGSFADQAVLGKAIAATILFCAASSAVYTINDLKDREKDALHPAKKKRPLVTGDVSPTGALVLLAFLLAAQAAGYLISPGFFLVLISYVALNVLYTYKLKYLPVIDIFTIAVSFVLRVYAGSQAISVTLSMWMFITTLCLALYLASIKRRQELALTGDSTRDVLKHYNQKLIDFYAQTSATGSLIFYSLFVVSSKPQLAMTIPLVLYGLFRYWYLVETLDAGESPTEALLTDWQLKVTVAAWVLLCAYKMQSGN